MAENQLPRIIVTEGEAAQMVALSIRTLQRLRTSGGGPVFVQLGGRRIGYQVADLTAWAEGRRAPSTSAVAAQRGRAA